MGILNDDMKRVIRQQRMGFMATVSADGSPNLSPKGTTTVWDDDHLVFANLGSPGTIENLRHNQACELNIIDYYLRKGYRFKGTAEVLTSGPKFEEIKEAYTTGSRGISTDNNQQNRTATVPRLHSRQDRIRNAGRMDGVLG